MISNLPAHHFRLSREFHKAMLPIRERNVLPDVMAVTAALPDMQESKKKAYSVLPCTLLGLIDIN